MITALLACVATMSVAHRPNVVLIYIDDLGYGDVTLNGAQSGLTPNVDRLASQGLTFTDAHCSAATCTPSRYTLLTGQYAFRKKGTGVAPGDANMIIDPGTMTIASALKQAGYTTGVVGKWHLGLGEGPIDWNGLITPGPESIGFNYHFLIPATGDRVPTVFVEQGRVVNLDPSDPIRVSYKERIDESPSGKERPDLLKMGLTQGHDQTIVNGISRIGWMTGGQSARWVDEDIADTLTRKAVSFIDKNKGGPFFLYFATQDIHVPRAPNKRFVGKSGMGPRGDAIVEMDWIVGQVLKTLDKDGLTDKTLVIFTSDNGPVLDDGYADQANELLGAHKPAGPFRAGKYSRFEGGTRVPMIVRWPGFVKPGTTTDALFGQVDISRTLADLAGVKTSAQELPDSRDALAALIGKPALGREYLVEEAGALSIRVGDWKYILPGSTSDGLGPWTRVQFGKSGALYDVRIDPGETTDVAAQHPDVVARLRALIEDVKANIR
ncbi:MAG TPA: arylsulfatase [Fimbriimonadaceae bacterium]|nr:arylsulfatase [Fimbriimonadaceae bacterium]